MASTEPIYTPFFGAMGATASIPDQETKRRTCLSVVSL